MFQKGALFRETGPSFCRPVQNQAQTGNQQHPMAASVSRQGWRQLVQRTASSSTPSRQLLISSRGPLSSSATASARQHFSTKRFSSATSPLRSNSGSSSRRSYSSSSPPPPPPPRAEFKVWPFVVLIAITSGGYMLLVNRRKGELLSVYSI